MSRPARLLLGSLAINAVLIATFAIRPALLPSQALQLIARATGTEIAETPTSHPRESSQPKATVAAPADFWRTLDSKDLPTLVRNLRAAGFSPTIVRGIVVVRVNERIHAQLQAFAASIPDTSFWKGEPYDAWTSSKYYAEHSRLFTVDRWQAVAELAGDDTSPETDAAVRARQQRQYGDLPAAKIEQLRRIFSDYSEMEEKARTAAAEITLPDDEEKRIALERAKRADIEALLTSEELASYDLRYSPLTRNLRAPLTFMNATEEEFRTIYEIHRPFAAMLHPSDNVVPTELTGHHHEARQEVATRLRAALGEARYADFVRASVREFQILVGLAERAEIPIENAARAFDSRGSYADESNRIFDESNWTPDQKRIALQDLAKRIRGQLIEILGPTAGNQYANLADWIRLLDRGSAISLGADGTMKPSRSLSPLGAAGTTPSR